MENEAIITKCPKCGGELIPEQTLDMYNEDDTHMIRICFGRCDNCWVAFTWKERYEFVNNLDIREEKD